jgi:hypothetical protein
LRRAMILRSLLEIHAKPIFTILEKGKEDRANVHSEVIRKFLYATKYEHGVRSMEAIIQASVWIDNQFLPASLPSDSQAKSHWRHDSVS